MATKSDTRNTSKGMTPNKAIRRPSNPSGKKSLGKSSMRRTQGK